MSVLYWVHQAAFLHEQGLLRGHPDGTVRFSAQVTVGEAKVILARLLRAGPSPGPGTADAALRKAGMDPEVAAAPEERLSYARALVLLDRAFSLPLYARFSQR